MKIFPAIDISDGKVVRLTKGDYDKMTVYSSSPLDIAKGFIDAGAEYLHVVDLDGAKDGAPVNAKTVNQICGLGRLFIEIGGGIRCRSRIEDYINAGAGRVILGTVAVKNYDFVLESVNEFGDKIAVGVDAKDGRVAVSGWYEITDISSVEFCKKLNSDGVKTVIYTDISCDGALAGTNLSVYEELSHIDGLDIIASGGITFEDEIRKLSAMNIYGAILGKAIYTGRLDLARAIKIARGKE